MSQMNYLFPRKSAAFPPLLVCWVPPKRDMMLVMRLLLSLSFSLWMLWDALAFDLNKKDNLRRLVFYLNAYVEVIFT